MYKSRYIFKNDEILLAVDSISGEFLELSDLKTGDNKIKNIPFELANLFSVCTEGKKLSVPHKKDIDLFPEAAARISSTDGKTIAIEYSSLVCGDRLYDIGVRVSVILDGSALHLCAQVENRGEYEIDSFCFPVLNGVYHNASYRDDNLVFPSNAGMKFVNPVEYLSKQPAVINWKWQEYRYRYLLDGVCGWKNADGLYSYAANYPGPLSMAWTDLYDDTGGLYFGMHEDNGIVTLRVETAGPQSPGIRFSFEKKAETKGDISSSGFCIALHEGDWHEGADIYRNAVPEKSNEDRLDWWEKSVSLYAHYDFKYQNGGVVHRFSDIPLLVDKAKADGADHILISGWHLDGFDHGFPMYVCDPELGTLSEMAQGLSYAHSIGVHVSFYINTRLANMKYTQLETFISENRVIPRSGISNESYGDKSLEFATMCAMSKGWQDRLVEAIEYVLDAGATGVYLDQLAMATPVMCHNPAHSHSPDEWAAGYREVLTRAGKLKTKYGERPSLMIEGCCDRYGELADGGLISTFVARATGSFPELFRYTYPGYRLIDMAYPSRHLAMRPVHVAKESKNLIDTAFVQNLYTWAYDLEEDNTFDFDPEMKAYLMQMLELKRLWAEKYSDFVFQDTKYILYKSDGLNAKVYRNGEEYLVAYSAADDEENELLMSFPAEIVEYTCEGGKQAVMAAIDPLIEIINISYSKGGLILLRRKYER